MATLTELYLLRNDSDMRNKVTVAIAVVLEEFRASADTSENTYYKTNVGQAERLTDTVWESMLAQNVDADTSAILAADDTTITTAARTALRAIAGSAL